MRSYITPGIIHFMAFPETIRGEGPIVETVRTIAEDAYFGFIELTWIKDPVVREEVRAILATSGIGVGYGSQPRTLLTGLNLNHLDSGERNRAIATLKEGIDEAYELGATGFGFLSGPYQADRQEEAFDALKESVETLCAYAAERGELRLHLEIFDYDIDKCSLIGPAPLAARFARGISAAWNNFGLLPDLSHLPLLRESASEALGPIREYITHVHIGNCVVSDSGLPGYGDQHPRFGYPNSENGIEELVDFLSVLIEIGYLREGRPRPVSFEVKPMKGEEPKLVIANAKRILDSAWALL